ncbi:hypothetical protein AAEX28_07100 [Lentisphaerota bacterium WC36G]|nr:hypothetical protein LJT99_09965 [Lentisphaerae bacterium WC36]
MSKNISNVLKNAFFRSSGAYLRRVVRNLIKVPRTKKKYRKKSLPGQAPYSHTKALKNSILFAVSNDSVVIGPAANLISDIGALHEFGGIRHKNSYREMLAKKKFKVGSTGPIRYENDKLVYTKILTIRQAAKANNLHQKYVVNAQRKTAHYPRRPFMSTGLYKSVPKIAQIWAQACR